MQPDKETASELQGTISGLLSLIQTTRTNISNPEMVERFIQERERTIAKLQNECVALRASLDNGPQLIRDTQAQIRVLKERLGQIKHREDIERLLRIAEQIKELQDA